MKNRKIPLMPRSPTSQDLKDSMKKSTKAKGKGNEDSSPLPPDDPDERLVYDAFKNASSHVNNIVIYLLLLVFTYFLLD